ncbi:MAG: helix-turn-helix transcriptional regulator [Candidatus Heimdallarchaeota archaeon]
MMYTRSSSGKKENLSSRDKILEFLLVNRVGPDDSYQTSVKDIAEAAGISVNAARQYLLMLEKEELVTRTQRKGTTGRPAMVYALNPSALNIFPKDYADFGIRLLKEIKRELGSVETKRLLEKMGITLAKEVEYTIQQNHLEPGKPIPLKKKLDAIAEILANWGVYPQLIEKDGEYNLRLSNCLVYRIATKEPLVCTVHETIISELLGKNIPKDKCIRLGDECCLYRIEKT